jgi:hypothetical protein
MPIRLDHNSDYIFDVVVRDIRLEQVAHAIDEDGSWCGP